MKEVQLRVLNKGDFFKLKPTETSTVWVKGVFIRQVGKYSTYKFKDTNHERLLKGDTFVYIDFEF